MPEAGFSHDHLRSAQALWVDFSGRRELRVTKPAVYAATIEYAIAMLHSVQGVTQAAVGRRYGVAPATISSRYAEIRAVMALVPGDPRYCGGVEPSSSASVRAIRRRSVAGPARGVRVDNWHAPARRRPL